ncbi:unnamed protein product [Linum tenue]|uniref:Trigger factor ribosome-binding bacterial domain-containing protein n=1 Tax=Linum tenue TaxID=586396 RepID=A0AAV0QIA9_9ROSI|nr:unnamed protein product [Linum tenue]
MMEVVVAPEACFFVFIHKGLNRRTAVPEAGVRNLSFKTPSFYHGVGCNSATVYIGSSFFLLALHLLFCYPAINPFQDYMVMFLKHLFLLVSEDVGVSSSRIGDFRVITTSTDDSTVMKVNVEVSGTKTRAIFDDVFDRMVEAAQPIPGFRRVKGGNIFYALATSVLVIHSSSALGLLDNAVITPPVFLELSVYFFCYCLSIASNECLNFLACICCWANYVDHWGTAGKTPNIPRDILLEILGASRVYKEVIKKVINSAMAEYVDKEGLKVGKDLRVEQSFEDLEEAFSPGEKFSFDAVLRLQSGAD